MVFPFLILLSLFSQLSHSAWLREYKGWYLFSRNKCIFSISEDSFQLSRYTTFSKLDGRVWTRVAFWKRFYLEEDGWALYLLSLFLSWWKSFRDRVSLGSIWTDAVCHSMAETWSGWSHCICNKKSEDGEGWCQTHLLLSFLQSRISNAGWVFCAQLNISGNSLTGRPRDVSSRLL